MHRRPLRRATALALTGVLVLAGSAFADSVRADGDTVAPGAQTTIDIGDVAPGAVVTLPIGFDLTCAGSSHPDAGQTITLSMSASSPAPGGAILSVTPGEVAPIPTTWTPDGSLCPSPTPHWSDGDFSQVTLQAPLAPNVGYTYTVAYAAAISPPGNDDANAIRGAAAAITIRLAVVANVNQAPILTLPDDMTVEGNTTGGWTASYPGVGAADAEDDPDPTPSCLPAPGSVIGLGTRTISCTVTDSGGRSASGSFHVTVVDTTAPTLSGIPADVQVTTGDSDGALVSYVSPTASDVVDPSPTVGCAPASGSMFPVGTTTITCTAADASGNIRQASFAVDVRFLAPHTASAIWLEPVGSGETFSANHSRTIPIKVRLFVDGVERSTGDAHLTITPCSGGSPTQARSMTFSGGRWNASIDTSMLAGACYTVSASIDSLTAGSFRLELRGDVGAARTTSKPAVSSTPPKAGPKGR